MRTARGLLSIAKVAAAVLCITITSVKAVEPQQVDIEFGLWLDLKLRETKEWDKFSGVQRQGDEKAEKHVPRIDLEKKADGVTAAVSMKHGMDWTAPHMITEVLVHDQNKKVVHKHVFDSSEDTAKTEFKVPSGTESLVAYEFCNKHGVWASDPVIVPQFKDEV